MGIEKAFISRREALRRSALVATTFGFVASRSAAADRARDEVEPPRATQADRDPGPSLGAETAGDLVPKAFVSSVGTVGGLDTGPSDYFPA